MQDVRVGLHWTAVVVQSAGVRRCGLASTLAEEHTHGGPPDIPEAGSIQGMPARELAWWALAPNPTAASVGVAALNALLLEPDPSSLDLNAEHILESIGRDRVVSLVGHFPFADRLRGKVGKLHVLEQRPRPGDLPASAAAEVIPKSDVVAITSMTLANHTLDDLLALCQSEARVMLLGPSTPLTPKLFEHGVDLLSGAVVTAINPVLRAVSQAANFSQIHRAGARLATLTRPGLELGELGETQ